LKNILDFNIQHFISPPFWEHDSKRIDFFPAPKVRLNANINTYAGSVKRKTNNEFSTLHGDLALG
jgi:hypothetical protein